MTNRHIDPATRFWNEAGASRTADYDPTDEPQEDVKSAYREASARASERDELDTARDDWLAYAHGLPATQGAVRDHQQAAQYQQQEAALSQWLTQTEAAGGFAEDYRELEPVTVQVLEHMNANGLRTDNVANDLHNAIVYARELTAKARQQQHDKEAAEKARHASRSLSGSHADTKPSDKPGDDDESVEVSVARAYRAHAA